MGLNTKKGYLSFGLKGLSCGFSTIYFDKISEKCFVKKSNYMAKLFTNTTQVYQIVITLKFPLQSCIYFYLSSCHHIT
jgi:hypothetical protein